MSRNRAAACSFLHSYIELLPDIRPSGVMVVLTLQEPILADSLDPNDIFVVVPLQHHPVLKDDCLHTYGRRVGLVDPLDMLPVIYELTERPPGQIEDAKNVSGTFCRNVYS